MAIRPPANLQPPPGVVGWYGCWCQEHGLNPYHPERWSAVERAEYAGHARFLFRMRWRRLLDGGDVALIRAQSGRAHLIQMVRAELAEALAGAPSRSPYLVDPCHPHRVGLPRDEKAREEDPIGVIREAGTGRDDRGLSEQGSDRRGRLHFRGRPQGAARWISGAVMSPSTI